MKILKSADDRSDKQEVGLACPVFIALVLSLWLHAGFFINNQGLRKKSTDPVITARKFSIDIMIVFEKSYRINHTLI